jgi:RNA polymerase sigma-70 factor, ECF subfamily
MKRESLGEYFTQHAMRLRRVIGRVLGSSYRDHTEDVLQETMIKVHQNLHTFRQESSIDTWIFRIATNEALMTMKYEQRRRHDSIEALAGQSGVRREPWYEPIRHAATAEWQRSVITEAIDHVPQKYRSVVILRYIQECSVERTAEILNVNTGTVKSRSNRGMRFLQTYFKRRKYDPDYLL